jgi:hypothetical protein
MKKKVSNSLKIFFKKKSKTFPFSLFLIYVTLIVRIQHVQFKDCRTHSKSGDEKEKFFMALIFVIVIDTHIGTFCWLVMQFLFVVMFVVVVVDL